MIIKLKDHFSKPSFAYAKSRGEGFEYLQVSGTWGCSEIFNFGHNEKFSKIFRAFQLQNIGVGKEL